MTDSSFDSEEEISEDTSDTESDHEHFTKKIENTSNSDKDRKSYGLLKSYHGISYQIQWLTLVALEAKNRSESVTGFTFRTEVDEANAGKFDDVVWQYSDSNWKRYYLLQAKHKLNIKEMITTKDIEKKLSITKNNPFGLQKYFTSYREHIKNNPKYKDGIIENLIIATNIDIDDTLKTKLKPFDKEISLLNIYSCEVNSKQPKCWQIDPEESMYELLEDTFDLIKLAKCLEKHVVIYKQKFSLPEYLDMYSKNIKKYVFNSTGHKISNDFIENKNLTTQAAFLREAFFHEAFVKKQSNISMTRESQITNPSDFATFVASKINEAREKVIKLKKSKNYKENINRLANFVLVKNDGIKFNPNFWTNCDSQLPNVTFIIFRNKLKENLHLLGILNDKESNLQIMTKLDKYRFQIANFETCRSYLIDDKAFWVNVKNYSCPDNTFQTENCSCDLPNYNISKVTQDIQNFFGLFVLAVNYSKKCLSKVVGNQLQQNLKWMDSEYTAQIFRSEIAKALDLTEDKFISSVEEVAQFFEKFNQETNRLILLGPTLEYCSMIEKLELKFLENATYLSHVQTFVSNKNSYLCATTKNVLHITTLNVMLSSIKVYNVLKDMSQVEPNSYMFLRLETVNYLQDFVISSFKGNIQLMVIICDGKKGQNTVDEAIKQFCSVLHNNGNKKVIIITTHDELLKEYLTRALRHTYKEITDSDIFLKSLDEITQNKILQKSTLMFQGKELSANIVIHKVKHLVDCGILYKFLINDDIKIYDKLSSLENISNYYVTRKIICRTKLNKNFYCEDVSDIFAFSNVKESELQRLFIKNKEKALQISKFTDIDMRRTTGTRFIILDDSMAEKQFMDLCNFFDEQNVHWFVKKKDVYKWKQTKGYLNELQKCLENRKEYDEDEIIDKCKKKRINIIAAEPGMGKSTLITHLAQKMKNLDPSILVIRINLNKYRSQLKHVLVCEDASAIQFIYKAAGLNFLKKIKSNNARKRILTHLTKTLNVDSEFDGLNLKSEDLLEIAIFKEKLFKSGDIYIFLDGFDEICPRYEEQAIFLINVLKNITLANIWITSRTYNIVNKLEDSTGTLSYLIKPLNIEKQRIFLLNFWKYSLKINEFDEKRSRIFIDELLNEFSKMTNDKKRLFVGIPLQLQMLAQNRLEMFKEFYESGVSILNNEYKMKIRMGLNLVDLYEKFINTKIYDIRFKEKKHNWPSDDSDIDLVREKQKEFINEYQTLAVHTLFRDNGLEEMFPEIIKDRIFTLLAKTDIKKDKNGIIDKIIDNTAIFVHQTYAEYFVALYIWNLWKNIKLDEFNNNFINKALYKNLFVGEKVQICKFFYFIADKELKTNKSTDFYNHEDKILSLLSHLGPIIKDIYYTYENTGTDHKNGFEDIAFTRLTNDSCDYLRKPNYVEVVKLLFSIVESYISVNGSKVLMKSELTVNMLRMASEAGCYNFVNIFIENRKCDYRESLKWSKWYFSPLWLAAKFGFLDVVHSLSRVINRDWLDKDRLSLTQRVYNTSELNVLRSCLILNILDANPYLDLNNFKVLPVARATSNIWPVDIVSLLLEKTDVNVFDEFIVEVGDWSLKAALYVIIDLVKYDKSVTDLFIKKRVNFFGALNILLFEYSRNNLDVSEIRFAHFSCSHAFYSEHEFLNMFEIICKLLISGVSYNCIDMHGTSTVKYSKQIYYIQKLFQIISNDENCNNILDKILRLMIDTVVTSIEDFKLIIQDSNISIFMNKNSWVDDDKSPNSQYETKLSLIPDGRTKLYDWLSKSTEFIRNSLAVLEHYISKANVEIEQFKKYRDSKIYNNIFTGFEEMLEYHLFSDKDNKIKLFKSLTEFEKKVLSLVLRLYIRQDYSIIDAYQEVTDTVWKYKELRTKLGSSYDPVEISYEELLDLLRLRNININQEWLEITKNLLQSCGIKLLYGTWCNLSYIGEKKIFKIIQSMSQSVHVSEKIYILLNNLDQHYKRLIKVIKNNEYEDINIVLKNIPDNFIGAVINGQDEEYGSPLHYAVYVDNIHFVEILLKHGANPNQGLEVDAKSIRYSSDDYDQDYAGYTPMQLAIKSNNSNIKQLLTRYTTAYEFGKTGEELAVKSSHQIKTENLYETVINESNSLRGIHNNDDTGSRSTLLNEHCIKAGPSGIKRRLTEQ